LRVILRIKGGLGNQLFQFYAAKAYADNLNADLIIDISSFSSDKSSSKRSFELNLFELPKKYKLIGENRSRFKNLILDFKRRVLNGFVTDSMVRLRNCLGLVYIDGYFQTREYVDLNADTLDKIISKKVLTSKSTEFERMIDLETTIGIHLRLGDYTLNNSFHVSSQQYIDHCLAILAKNKVNFTQVLIFTDSPDMVNKYIKIDANFNLKILGEEDFSLIETLYLLSRFKHLILSNSTFSWWAARIGDNELTNFFYPTCEFHGSYCEYSIINNKNTYDHWIPVVEKNFRCEKP